MPYRKRKYNRRKKKKSYANSFSRNIQYKGPLAHSLKSQLKYSDMYTLTSSTSPSSQVFSLNGLFDPNITGVGHQPRGFDQLMLLYDHYVVIGASIDILFHNNDSNRGVSCFAMIRDSATAETSYVDCLEDSTRIVRQLGARDGAGANTRMKFNINPNKFLTRSKPLSDPELKGSVSANPAEQCYLHMGHIAEDLVTGNTTSLTFTITYTAVFIEPKQPTIS